MGFTSDFLAGVAQLVDDNGLGVFRPTGTYQDNETAVVIGTVPASPSRLIVVTKYDDRAATTLSDSSFWLQFRTRGTTDIRSGEDLQDSLFDLFHNLPRQVIGNAVVSGCWRRSFAYIGVDSNSRHEHTGNYEFALHRPSPHRI